MPRSIGRYCRSERRALRIGPTVCASREWNTTAYRVIPPSTSISNTMSASARPDCGRALGSFGTRTTIGRRFVASALGASVPRSGQIAFAAAAVPVAAEAGSALEEAVGLPEQATRAATASSASRRMSGPMQVARQ